MTGLARDGDEWAVGLPRWSADTDMEAFHRRVAELAERFGTEVELPKRTEGGPDVFVHVSAVERAGMRGLVEGQKLNFDIVTERGKQAASNLQDA